MKNITFTSLIIQNFLSIGKPITINFTNGINIITGENKDKADKNGVGKSAIIDALYFAIFGDTLRELKKDYIVNNIAKKNCKVDLYFNIDKNGVTTKYHIERGISPSYCKVWVDDTEDITLSTIPATNLYILNLFNSTPAVFKNTITMGINNSIPFMAQKKNQKREFIEGILRLEIFKAMTKVARENYEAIFNEYNSNIRLYEEIAANIKNYEIRKSDEEKNRQMVIVDFHKKIEDKQNLIESIRKTLKVVDGNELEIIERTINGYNKELSIVIDKYNILVSNLGGLKSRQTINQKQLAQCINLIATIKIELDQINSLDIGNKTVDEFTTLIKQETQEIDTLKTNNHNLSYTIKTLKEENRVLSSIGNTCITCKRPFPDQDILQNTQKQKENDSKIVTYQLEIDSNLQTINNKLKNITNHDKAIKILTNKAGFEIKLVEYSKQKDEIDLDNNGIFVDLDSTAKCMTELEGYQTRWKKTLSEAQDKKTNIKMEIQTYNYGLETISNYEKEIIHYTKAIETQKNLKNPFIDLIVENNIKKDKLETVINDAKEKITIYDIIKHVVSDVGIKAFIIKKLLGVLNERINYYLSTMDANCKLIFDEVFNDTITNDRGIECDYNNFSGGERKRIDLACLFAFMDIRRLQGDVGFNLAFYDELLDSALSVNGSIRVFDILKERVDKYNEASYIVTHRNENLNNPNINNILYLEKSGGITRLKEVVN